MYREWKTGACAFRAQPSRELNCTDIPFQVKTGTLAKQPIPSAHAKHLCTYHEADKATVQSAIEGALAAKAEWEAMPWSDRAAIFLKAADLVSGKYRYKLLAATMLGQGKNAWQAEIDAAAEVSGFHVPWGLCGIDLDARAACFSSRISSGSVSSTWRNCIRFSPRETRLEAGSAYA